MELRHLRYFIAVAEEENFHRAARKLHVSQSPLSRQIQQLEEEIGVELFERVGRGVKVTLAGRLFLERAKAIVASVGAAIDEAQKAAQGHIGTVTIGFEPGQGFMGALSSIVGKFRKKEPLVNVELLPMPTGDQWEALRLGKIGLGFGAYAPADGSLQSAVHARYPLGVILPKRHRLAKKPRIAMKDLANEPVFLEPRAANPRLYDDILAAARARGVAFDVRSPVIDGEAMWTLVASGLGVTFLPQSVEKFISFGAVIWRPVRDLGIEMRDIVMWRASDARSPLLRPLIDLARSVKPRRV